MALILNIETSTDICSIALSENGKLIASSESSEMRSHAAILTVLIEELLHKNNISCNHLDAIAVSKGPGSYTGLRIGVSVAKGLCYGASKPLIGINTLQSMMNGIRIAFPEYMATFPDNARFCPMLDARRQEVYMAIFHKDGTLFKETCAAIIEPNSFEKELETHPIVFFGNGAEKCKSLIIDPHASFLDNFALKASYMNELSYEAFQLEHFEDIAYFEPFYLKDFVATIPKRKVI
jgi:tRNA threonylcarbamoyladenosine biosynthesis protein TsaB